MKRYNCALLVLISVVVMVSCFAEQTLAGTFKDRDGGSHTWTIGSSHELIWDGSPYVPFATTFQPESYQEGASESALKADSSTLDGIRKSGIVDIIVKPKKCGLGSVSLAALQGVVDLLESKGFRYGIDLSDGPFCSLEGYVVDPANQRTDGIKSSGVVTKSIAGAKTVLTVLCDASNGDVRKIDEFPTFEDSVSVPVTIRSGAASVLLFYPYGVMDLETGMPDLWSDYSRHRDRLVAGLSKVKFGKGLRFFIDPYTSDFSMRGDSDKIIPASKSFRVQYAAWLSRKYQNLRELSLCWGLTDKDAESYEEAARYVPLWGGGRGVRYVYDPATGHKYAADPSVSTIWADLSEFRLKSVRAWMDGIADALKNSCVDVPVVFSAQGLQPMFSPSGQVGYDGLAASRPDQSISEVQSAGEVLSTVERSQRKVWMLSTVRPSGSAFPSKADLFASINTYRTLGSKGFLVEGLQDAKGDAGLGWLSEYGSTSRDDKAFASYRPRAVYYLKGALHASTKKLGNGAWWLPTDDQGAEFDLGPSLAGYVLASRLDGTDEIYVWSLRGVQTIHLLTHQPLRISKVLGEETVLAPKKGVVEFQVDSEPLIVRGIAASSFVPNEVALALIETLQKAVDDAAAKHIDATVCKASLDRAKDLMRKNDVAGAANMVRASIEEMKHFMTGFQPRSGGLLSIPGVENIPATGGSK